MALARGILVWLPLQHLLPLLNTSLLATPSIVLLRQRLHLLLDLSPEGADDFDEQECLNEFTFYGELHEKAQQYVSRKFLLNRAVFLQDRAWIRRLWKPADTKRALEAALRTESEELALWLCDLSLEGSAECLFFSEPENLLGFPRLVERLAPGVEKFFFLENSATRGFYRLPLLDPGEARQYNKYRLMSEVDRERAGLPAEVEKWANKIDCCDSLIAAGYTGPALLEHDVRSDLILDDALQKIQPKVARWIIEHDRPDLDLTLDLFPQTAVLDLTVDLRRRCIEMLALLREFQMELPEYEGALRAVADLPVEMPAERRSKLCLLLRRLGHPDLSQSDANYFQGNVELAVPQLCHRMDRALRFKQYPENTETLLRLYETGAAGPHRNFRWDIAPSRKPR